MRGTAWLLCALVVGSTGCQLANRARTGPDCDRVSQLDSRTEYGKKRPVLDGVGWVIGIPEKILLWNIRADNHRVTPETVANVEDYLHDRGLDDVKVRVNQYDPIGEWRRLRANRRMAPGWRYTVGTLVWLEYTLLPGRVFGGDDYNPFTNTVSIYSDIPSIGIAEAAYAKDVHSRRYPGTYAAFQTVPILDAWHETIATHEALDYINEIGEVEDRREAYNVLYPRYGKVVGGSLGQVVTFTPGALFEVGGALIGHAAGRFQSSRIRPEELADRPAKSRRYVAEEMEDDSVRPVNYVTLDSPE